MAAACPVAAPAASPARTPHSVGVIFELRRADARPGETLSVTGGGRELGDWGAEDTCGLQLRTSVPVYPLWTMLSPVWIEVLEGQEELWLEYKYVRDLGQWGQAGHRIVWEDDIENRRARIPCKQPGVWVVSDAVWGGEGIQEIKLTLESEIGRRRNMLDPDPLAMPATVPGLPSAPTKKALRGRPQMYNMTPMASPRDQSSDSYAIEEEYDHLPLGSPTNTRPSLTPFPTAFSTPCPTPFPTPLPTLRLGAPGGGGGGGGGCAGSPGGLAKPGSPTSTPLPTPRLGARGTPRGTPAAPLGTPRGGAARHPSPPSAADWGGPVPMLAVSATGASDPETSGRERRPPSPGADEPWRQNEELRRQNEELRRQIEGLRNEELWRQTEKLRRQNEELRRQNEELRRSSRVRAEMSSPSPSSSPCSTAAREA